MKLTRSFGREAALVRLVRLRARVTHGGVVVYKAKRGKPKRTQAARANHASRAANSNGKTPSGAEATTAGGAAPSDQGFDPRRNRAIALGSTSMNNRLLG